MTNRRFSELFGIPPRQPESKITPEYMDLAASVQQVTEQLMLQIVAALHKKTSTDSLVMAGGVALNCVANGRILRESPFRNLWIQPASGDAGGALGAAMFVWYQLLGQPRKGSQSDRQHGSLLGPNFQQQTIEEELRKANLAFRTINKEADLVKNVAQLLDEQNVVGWFQGRMEFGPRALGNRSILADPRSEIMQSKVNTQIKYRESFRPFAPIILAEDASDWFEIASDQNSPYMLIVAPVKESRRTGGDNTSANQADLIQRVQCRRSEIPAVTHVDYSARLQTVEKLHNPKLHHLLTAFKQRTDCPVLINTSFNVRGEPIVCSPADAIRCFASTEMDVLVLGNSIVTKKNNPQLKTSPKAQEFSLD